MALSIVSGSAFLAALEHASSVELTSSILPRGEQGVTGALERAAQRGAQVRVHLEAEPYNRSASEARARINQEVVAALRAHGVDADLAAQTKSAPLHMKAALVDGRVFLDDRNWLADGRDTIVRSDSARDAAAIMAAMHGEHAPDAHLATCKADALKLEVQAINEASAGDGVDVESESFGSGGVAAALLERAQAGKTVRLLVCARDLQGNEPEKRALERLAQAGTEVRLESGRCDEKLCLAGEQAWVGSANATNGFPGTIDWGARTHSAPLVDALRAAFERNWSHAKAFHQARDHGGPG